MSVTPYYASLIDANDPDDPILRQILPLNSECCEDPNGYGLDPLAEAEHSPIPGMIHRYPDRVVLLTSGFCATLCRFCMRKRAWSSEEKEPAFDLDAVIRYLENHEEVSDVILSGGDPLFLPESRLREILERVRSIPSVRIVRIGTRVPVTLPMRVDDSLVAVLAKYRPLWLLAHFNHPREITPEAKASLDRLASAGVVLTNQSVLLKGVNDDLSVLLELSRKLLESGVRPYYLHQVDRVAGLDHFRVPMDEGMALVEAMFGKISGLGIPRYVLDLPGGKGKVPLMPDFVQSRSEKMWILRGPLGGNVDIPNG